MHQQPLVTICIPHWQVRTYITACLRSIRKHSRRWPIQTIVVDNGSQDDSLDYLRSLDWIDLIERPDESSANWPLNVFTAWDCGLEHALGRYYLTMHSDVFVHSDDWLEPLLAAIDGGADVAASGSWKLELQNRVYKLQKLVVGNLAGYVKNLVKRKRRKIVWRERRYPRDYCALYRADVLREHGLTFRPVNGCGGGGYSIAKQIWDAGYRTGMVPVYELARHVFHVAHGTAAVTDRTLNHRRAQRKVEGKVADLFGRPWIQQLLADERLDGTIARAA